MKKLTYYFFLFLILLSFNQCSREDQPEYIFRASLLTSENHPWYRAFNYFAEEIERRTEGRMRVEVYPSQQLGKEIESIRMIQAGVIDMTITGSPLSNWFEIAAFCEMPFLLRDSAEKAMIIHGDIGQRIEREMTEKVGLRALGTFQRGPRHLTSNRPIRHPDELNGLIIRVPNVPSFVTAWSAMGAKPTPMAFSEVFTSLQQGTIEAQENPFAMIRSAGFAEVQEYLNLTGHVVSWSYPVVGEKQFQALPDDLKAIFLETAKDMQDFQHQDFRENEEKVREELMKKGMKLIEVDKAAFGEKCEQAIFESLSPEMQEIYQQFIKEVSVLRMKH